MQWIRKHFPFKKSEVDVISNSEYLWHCPIHCCNATSDWENRGNSYNLWGTSGVKTIKIIGRSVIFTFNSFFLIIKFFIDRSEIELELSQKLQSYNQVQQVIINTLSLPMLLLLSTNTCTKLNKNIFCVNHA